ncbi:hypothetical protein GINT2_000748 [Glugoides intestinalis]
MLETFRRVCSTVRKLEIPIEVLESDKSKYRIEELLFIELGNRFSNTCNLLIDTQQPLLNSNELTLVENLAIEQKDKKFIWSNDELSIETNPGYKMFERRVAMLGLMYETPLTRRILVKKPELFEGYFGIKKVEPFELLDSKTNQIAYTSIETSKSVITLDLVDRRFRYCKIKPFRRVEIPIHNFCIAGQMSYKNEVRIYYKRKVENFLEQVALSCKDYGIEAIQRILTHLRISHLAFVQKRIELFLSNKISSLTVIRDVSFLSKIGFVEVDLHRIVLHLENMISIFKGDRHCYELYRLVGFLILVKKVKILPMCVFNYTRNQKYQVILHPPGFPKNYTNRLDGNIKSIFGKQRKRDLVETCNKLFYLKRIGMTIEEKFLNKVFSTECTALFAFLELKLSEQVPDIYTKQKSLLKLFTYDLNEILKKGENPNELYELLDRELDLLTSNKNRHMIDYVFDKITLVHERRTKGSTDIKVLKAVYNSIIKCEKMFGLRNREVELRLRKQAHRLLA